MTEELCITCKTFPTEPVEHNGVPFLVFACHCQICGRELAECDADVDENGENECEWLAGK